MIAGIRHKAGDVNFPFIALSSCCDTDLLISQRRLLTDILKDEFSVLRPKGFTLQLPASYDSISLPEADIWQLTLAGKFSGDVSDSPLTLKQVDRRFDYQAFVEQYRTWQMDNPVTGKVVSPADEEELGQSIDQGLCFHGRLNGQPIGLIAGLEQDYCGLKGCCILEEFIYEPWRGKGLAAFMQQGFHHLTSDRFETIWGTIDEKNIPSLKTALACGRTIREKEFFIGFT